MHTNDHLIMHLIMQYFEDSGSSDPLMLNNSINLMSCCYSVLFENVLFFYFYSV